MKYILLVATLSLAAGSFAQAAGELINHKKDVTVQQSSAGGELFHFFTGGLFYSPTVTDYVRASCTDVNKKWSLSLYVGNRCGTVGYAECARFTRIGLVSKTDGKVYDYGDRSTYWTALRFTNPTLEFLKVLTPNNEVVELTCDAEILNDSSYGQVNVFNVRETQDRLSFDRDEKPEVVNSLRSLPTHEH